MSRLDDDGFAWIAAAFAEHPVLVFRGQQLGAGDIAAFGRRFGAPRKHSLVGYRHAEHPEVSWLRNVDDAGNIDWYGVKRATDWHTDSTYEEVLPLLAMLHALEVPSARAGRCSPTCPPPMTRLPEAMKERLSGLVGLHGRTDGPAGARLYDPEEEMRRTDKKYVEQRRAGGGRASGQRPPDPVRQPDAHARLRRHDARRGLAD